MANSLLQRGLQDVTTQRDSGPARRKQSHNARAEPYSKAEDSWSHDRYDDGPRGGRRRTRDGGDQDMSFDGGRGSLGGRSNKLRIDGLHYEVSERELQALFSQIGTITDGPRIKFDKSGRSEGIAWLSFSTADQAQRAKEEYDGAPTKEGVPMTIAYDFSKPRGLGEGASLLARMGGSDILQSKGSLDRSFRGRDRGAPAGRGSSTRGRGRGGRGGGGGGGSGRSAPANEKDLDAELAAYMATD